MSLPDNNSDAASGTAVRRRVEIHGRVQGVGFRAWTVHRARQFGLRGTVRNLSDGSVEVDAAGQPEVMDQFLELLRRGPALAAVRELRELEPGSAPLPTAFEVAD
jgi:acylphosphatase